MQGRRLKFPWTQRPARWNPPASAHPGWRGGRAASRETGSAREPTPPRTLRARDPSQSPCAPPSGLLQCAARSNRLIHRLPFLTLTLCADTGHTVPWRAVPTVPALMAPGAVPV